MTIMVGTDFSENSIPALKLGAHLAKTESRPLVVIHVVDLAASDNAWRVLVETPEEIERSALTEAQEKLENFVGESLEEGERPASVDFRVSLGNPIDVLLEEAASLDEATILAGTRGGSRLKEFFLGSTARRLVRQAENPVVLVPPMTKVGGLNKIVVGVDFSKASREALRHAARLARGHDAKIHLVFGMVIPEVTALQASMASVATNLDVIVEEKEKSLNQMIDEEGIEELVASRQVLHMSPAMAISSLAEEVEADMIVMGSHGRRGWSRFFLGNTAERILRRAPCPVYVVRSFEEEE